MVSSFYELRKRSKFMFVVFEKLKWFFKQEKRRYILGVFVLLLANFLSMLPPKMIGDMVDQLSLSQMSLDALFRSIFIFFSIILLIYIANYLWSVYLFGGSVLLGLEMRRKVMRKMLGQTPLFFSKFSTGSLMARGTNDIYTVQDFAGFGIMSLMDSTVTPMIIIVVMALTLSWKLTLATILPLPLLFWFSKYVGKKLYAVYDESQTAFDKVNEFVLENVSAVRVIRAFHAEKNEESRFAQVAQNYYEKMMYLSILDSLYTPAVRIIPGVSYVIALAFGSRLISAGEMTIGALISFNVFLGRLVWPMMALGEYINVSEQASASSDRIDEVLFYEEDIIDEKEALEYKGDQDIRFDHFTFQYDDEKPTLEDITFSLDRGQTLGIVGKIGSGKTTLVRQLLRFYPHKEKSLYLGNLPIEAYQQESVRKTTGYVPQGHILFSKTIRENIAFGKQGATASDVDEAVNFADFGKDLVQLKDGLESMAGEKGISLSGGQKQRISIARASIREPEVLILDDSLSAVDANTEKVILENIKKSRQGKTTVIVAHRLSAVEHADKIIVLENGKIVQEGTHEELMKTVGFYKEQYELQKLEASHE